jgi:hypothetical protein
MWPHSTVPLEGDIRKVWLYLVSKIKGMKMYYMFEMLVQSRHVIWYVAHQTFP